MKIASCFRLALLNLWAATCVLGQQQWPIHNNGLNSVVEWDHYSYIINGERIYLWSGEIHYWRVPVPEIWEDILQKVKAAGFNGVSFYSSWAYHSAADGTLDFESGAHDFTRLFEITKRLGLYVLFRPGPYINAESSAGGFPGWLTTGAYGATRNNDSRYTDAWTPYFSEISKIVAEHQITNGGNVFIYQIENEYGQQWTNVRNKTPNHAAIRYMELLEAAARDSGIDVPLIANNPNMNTKSWSKDFSDEGGNVDNYALDHYPSCWSCNLSECTGTNGAVPDFTVFDYYTNFQEVAPTQPSFMAEFQGGSYNPWGGPQGGCVNNTGPNWVNVYYRHNIAEKISAMNVYMAFGGTNWGGIPYPNVGTSYDYSAPIMESRVIGSKYHETKLFGQFIRVARGLTKVDMVGNGTHYTSTSAIETTELRNPDTNEGYYVAIHAYSPSADVTSFKLRVSTSLGNFTIPQYANDIVLNGRQSKIIVTDFPIGDERLVYSTAEVLTVTTLGHKPIVFLWLPTGESGEFLISGARKGSVLKHDNSGSNVKFTNITSGTVASFTAAGGSAVLEFDNGIQVVVVDRPTAYETWMPSLSDSPFAPNNATVVVQGPYLIRGATLDGHHAISLTGDWSDETSLEVFGVPKSISSIIFNGKPLNATRTSYGSLVGKLAAPRYTVESILAELPALDKWKVNDGLPEREADYDDSNWIVADHTNTSNPTKPGTSPVLYADEYGFHTNNVLWRGKFSGKATGAYIGVIGGTSSGWSAYLNGVYIDSHLGEFASLSGLNLSFANASTTLGASNVLLIIQDNMGHDQTSGVLNPRGIMNATLYGPSSSSSSSSSLPSPPSNFNQTATNSSLSFTSWRVAGTAGGEANIDPVRGPMNEGGLHAERLGWHLPGFDDSEWEDGSSSSPAAGFAEPGVQFYRAVVPLDLPAGLDVSLGIRLGVLDGVTKYRAQLYVNGYMFGKFVPWIGNQISFPVFPGILNYHGDNTIGLSVWAMDAAGAKISVEWEVLGVVESSYDLAFDADYLRPAWTDRSEYA